MVQDLGFRNKAIVVIFTGDAMVDLGFRVNEGFKSLYFQRAGQIGLAGAFPCCACLSWCICVAVYHFQQNSASHKVFCQGQALAARCWCLSADPFSFFIFLSVLEDIRGV